MANDIILRADARDQGLKRYYTGVQCLHHHLSERFVRDGGCVACIYKKNANWEKRNPDKRRALHARWVEENLEYVKTKQKEYHAQWYKNNRDIKLSKNAEYLKANPDVSRKLSKKWRDSHIEESRKRCREWEKANPDKRSEINKRKYKANPEHYLAKNAKWAKENPEKTAVVRRRRRAREKGAPGTHTAAEATAILVAQNYRCAYCDADLRVVEKHLDHIIPLSRGGSNDKSNIQWTCKPHNLQKSDKDPIEYARSIGLLI